ncbi:SMI1/KNR4 family protein [Paenibacillus sp. 7124]|uniref:SMI1/KNR4 family protein n=1 Tax=Paenibacillus apii TaxID=1850370 RepID=A0A6M1PKM4_9BACL|nr:SMI1/KNR4 family protein [Paenibacillus apii]NGM83770.1 SMI1/KNR4 family protein [Paenibacillus apii]
MNIEELIKTLNKRSDCILFEPSSLPELTDKIDVPQELIEFYRLCGGGTLFVDSARPIEILKPSEVLPANLVILGEEAYEELLLNEENDISMKWYVVVRYDEIEYVTIDFDQVRCGRCYDSFHETHAVAGSCEIIALTFSEFLSNLLETTTKTSDGLYWLRDDFIRIGDAYEYDS